MVQPVDSYERATVLTCPGTHWRKAPKGRGFQPSLPPMGLENETRRALACERVHYLYSAHLGIEHGFTQDLWFASQSILTFEEDMSEPTILLEFTTVKIRSKKNPFTLKVYNFLPYYAKTSVRNKDFFFF